MNISEKNILKSSLIFIAGGFIGIFLGKMLQKDKEMTEKYLSH